MIIKLKAKELADAFENVFHNDWPYTSEMLNENILEEGETFLACQWITNWCNKDSLEDSFTAVKGLLLEPTPCETAIKNELACFITAIERVFDNDWEYTKDNLNIDSSIISDNATFLYPNKSKEELEIENWGYRVAFLEIFQQVKSL